MSVAHDPTLEPESLWGPACECPSIVWAKTLTDGNSDLRYPLLAHMLDTAAVAYSYFQVRVPDVQRRRLYEAIGGNEAESLDALCSLAGLHDIGKANPRHQLRIDTPSQERFADLVEPMAALGFTPLRGFASAQHEPLAARHEYVTQLYTDALGADPAAGRILAGHHGTYPDLESPGTSTPYREALLKSPWAESAGRMVSQVEKTVGALPLFDQDKTRESFFPLELLPVLTGHVCMCDWVASTELSVRHGIALMEETNVDPDEFYERRKEFLANEVAKRYAKTTIPEMSNVELFGFTPDRPPQKKVLELDEAPDLLIICAPTGDGKTEASVANFLRRPDEALVFALPTIATTNAMMARMEALFVGAGIGPTAFNLNHSEAHLGDFARHPLSDLLSTDFTIMNSAWANQSKLNRFAAQVTVSTIDGVLRAAKTLPGNTIPQAALSTAHVVIDECHTLDQYQEVLLERLLEFLGASRARVTLLSATLPDYLAEMYTTAYLRGYNGFDPEALPVTAHLSVNNTYPALITVTDGQAPVIHELEPSRRDRDIRIIPHEVETHTRTDAMVAKAKDILDTNPDAKVLLIRNQVHEANRTAHELGASSGGYRTSSGEVIPVQVFHSRHTRPARAAAAEAVLDAAGPGAPSGGVIVVATQVVEQSLNVDFDILLCDLCPAAHLVQRAGRIWRHSEKTHNRWKHPEHRRSSRKGLGPPTVHVFAALAEGADYLDPNVGSLPYHHNRLHVTLGWLKDHGTQFQVPQDVAAMVNHCDAGPQRVWEMMLNTTDPEFAPVLDVTDTAIAAEQLTEVVGIGDTLAIESVQTEFLGAVNLRAEAQQGAINLEALALSDPGKIPKRTEPDAMHHEPRQATGTDVELSAHTAPAPDGPKTRSMDETAGVLVLHSDSVWGFDGNLPTVELTPADQRRLLEAVVPVSHSLARIARKAGIPLRSMFSDETDKVVNSHPILSTIYVLDMLAPEVPLALTDTYGLVSTKWLHEVDASSNEVQSNEVQSNEVQSNEVQSNEVQSNEVQSNEVQSNEVQSTV